MTDNKINIRPLNHAELDYTGSFTDGTFTVGYPITAVDKIYKHSITELENKIATRNEWTSIDREKTEVTIYVEMYTDTLAGIKPSVVYNMLVVVFAVDENGKVFEEDSEVLEMNLTPNEKRELQNLLIKSFVEQVKNA